MCSDNLSSFFFPYKYCLFTIGWLKYTDKKKQYVHALFRYVLILVRGPKGNLYSDRHLYRLILPALDLLVEQNQGMFSAVSVFFC